MALLFLLLRAGPHPVAHLSLFFRIRTRHNGEVVFAQFPIAQEKKQKKQRLSSFAWQMIAAEQSSWMSIKIDIAIFAPKTPSVRSVEEWIV